MEETVAPEEVQSPPDKTKALYDALSKDYDLGSYDEFSQKIQNPDKRKALYDEASKEYDLGSYDDFDKKESRAPQKANQKDIEHKGN